MTALTDVFSASFRGVNFFVRRSSTTGGRRTVIHEFVNSNFREVEDLGPDLKQFSINAFVTSQRDANKLIEALEKKGSAVLSHPFLGEHTVSLSAPYIVDNDMATLGVITFDLSFAIKLEKFVSKKVSTLDNIRDKASELSDSLGLDVAKDYFNAGIAAINATTDFINEVSDKIESISEMYSQAINTVSQLTASIQGIKNNIIIVSNLPNRMSNDLTGLMDGITAIFDEKKEAFPDVSPSLSQNQRDLLSNTDGVDEDIMATEDQERVLLENATVSDLDLTDSDTDKVLFSSLETLFSFNKDSIRVSEIVSDESLDLNGNDAGATSAATVDVGNAITQEQAEIITNEKLLTRVIRIGALSRAYVAATDIQFISVQEIEDFQNTLEAQYQSVVSDLAIPTTTLKLMQELRDAAEAYFFDQKLTANQVLEIRINTMPAQVLAFSLYGDTDNTSNLIELNSTLDVSALSGDVQVVTA